MAKVARRPGDLLTPAEQLGKNRRDVPGRVAIVGAAESDYGRVPGRTELDLHAQAAARALEQAGLTKDDVDGLFSLTQDFLRCPSLVVAEYLGLHPRYEDCTHVGGASFEVMVEHAVAALDAALRRCRSCTPPRALLRGPQPGRRVRADLTHRPAVR